VEREGEGGTKVKDEREVAAIQPLTKGMRRTLIASPNGDNDSLRHVRGNVLEQISSCSRTRKG